MLENEDVEISLMRQDNLLRVSDLRYDVLSQSKQRLFHEIGEEEQPLEDGLVCLFEVVSAEGSWEFFHELHLLFNVEHFLDIGVLFNIAIDLLGKGFANMVLINELLEDLQALALFNILGANVGNERADAVDVVRKHDAAYGFDEDHAQCFLVANWSHVSEPDGQHDRRSPVVGPYVLFVPG